MPALLAAAYIIIRLKFVEKFPWLAKVVSFKAFSDYVDDALDEMKDILEKNTAIASIVEGGEDK